MAVSNSSLDLVWLGEREETPPEWHLGEVFHVNPTPGEVSIFLEKEIAKSSADAYLFWKSTGSALPHPSLLIQLLDQPVDIWHAGLRDGMAGQPDLMRFVAPSWIYAVNPDPEVETVSWRMSLGHCLVRTWVFKAFGLPSVDFNSLEIASLSLGFRCIKGGAIIKYTPRLLAQWDDRKVNIDFSDQLKFILHAYGKHWGAWALLNALPSHPVACLKNISQVSTWKNQKNILNPQIEIEQGNSIDTVSVVLPTLDRYDYLPGCLQSLREQTYQPVEIICVDQNSKEDRRPDIYEAFDDLPLKVIWQDEKGQSTARNRALKDATGDWVFFIDDDSTYPENAIQVHMAAVKHYSADASTGLSVPPRDYKIPENYIHYRLAHNLDTGNCLVRKSLVLAVGGFDRQYDFGKGADQDLGMRLYKCGGVIIHNPQVIRVHYKAEGGLRQFGVLWDNRSIGKGSPRPPVTISYYYYRHFPGRLARQAIFQSLLFSNLPSSQTFENRTKETFAGLFKGIMGLPFLLLRVVKSLKGAKKKISEGPGFIES